MPNTNNQFSFLDYTGLSLFWSKVKKIIEDNELVTSTALTNLDTRVDNLEYAISDQIISKTYTELKTLRDNGQLVPGQQYRITDYTCTTTQAGTTSAGHAFDIIVTADSENKLNEEARATQHEGETYFVDCDLNAWKIWYSLDNDTTRFAWADSTNGKGVIYRMIDEWNNDVPYDFKNIQFYRQYDSNKSLWSTISSDNTGVPCYTFSSRGYSSTASFTDMSLALSNRIYSNVIKDLIKNNKQTLNNNCFFGSNSYSNSFGDNCERNSFGYNCYYNTFGNGCDSNSFGNGYYYNTFGNGCDSNTFGNNCYYNTFGNDCRNNSFRLGCENNTFGNGCDSNSFGSYNSSNIFGNDCSSNIFGNDCSSNIFGNGCWYITFGNDCRSNSFANNCWAINFASDKKATTKYNYYKNNYFGDGCQYIVFTGAETGSDSVQVQNYKFAQGLQGTSSAYLTIEGKRNRAYETYISKDKGGTIQESVIAENTTNISTLTTNLANETEARTQADAELQSKINLKQDTLTAGENIKIENNVISAIDATKLLVNTTWSELKALRDNSQLVPGQQYRITNYYCLTATPGTTSAFHIFDIIVTADSENTLNEEARAAKHEGDDYFADNDLSVWRLWYCLDNDTTRFAWADGMGMGVIYRMIDEFNNDVPYDFKNIQFYRQWDESKSLWSTISSDTTGIPCYTFNSMGGSSTVEFRDNSLSLSNNVHSNVIKEYISDGKLTLNNNCFFDGDCHSNTFGNNCYNNTFGYDCHSNTFGYDCYSNTFEYGGYSNTIGDNCYSNTFGEFCYGNTFGYGCSRNTFGDICAKNSFGNYCSSNTIGNYFSDNTIGNYFSDNTFEEFCNYNTIGNYFSRNTIGNYCSYNTFGNDCYYIKFAADSSASTKYNYYRDNHFGDGCWYILFKGAETGSDSVQVQNYKFAQGLQGTSSAYLTIEGKRNRAYETYISKDKGGTIQESVIAENTTNISTLTTNLANETEARTQADAELREELFVVQDITSDIDMIRAQSEYGAMAYNDLPNYQPLLTAGENIKIENNVISAIDATKLSVNITWSELKTLRDNSQLVAGQQYRITDYTCTTATSGTKSAGHVFDVIVTADSENKLNEEARAIQHVGDDYFSGCDLNAWKLWYCLDNDTTRFGWADSTNGKGVIYRMIDEFNNDVPYDFKNIQFYRQYDSNKSLWSTISSDNTGVACYTFSSAGNSSTVEFTDMSLLIDNNIRDNIIRKYISSNKQTLNNNCSFGDNFRFNSFGGDCHSNTFGNYCKSNTFGSECYGNTFGNSCYQNFFGNSCQNNSFSGGSSENSFGDWCNGNSFESDFSYNSSGNFFVNNSFGEYCRSNSFGNYCRDNSFGYRLTNNSFGNSCTNNSFGEWCYNNSFGNKCTYNSFGDYCESNRFGNDCYNIKFASNSSASTKYNYYRNNHFGDGCRYILFKGAETASDSAQVQNYNFTQGLQGTSSAYLTVDGVRNRTFETKVAKNSNGDLKIYCEADLIK